MNVEPSLLNKLTLISGEIIIVKQNLVETEYFNESNWPKLKKYHNTIDWPTTFCGTLANVYIDVAIDTISEKCTMFVPQKTEQKKYGFQVSP